MRPLHYYHILAAGKLDLIQITLKGYYNNTITVRISLDGYGSKIRKVIKFRPTVLNEAILAKAGVFVYKSSPHRKA